MESHIVLSDYYFNNKPNIDAKLFNIKPSFDI